MKSYILTEHERQLIKAYMEEGVRAPQLRNLKKRAWKSLKQLEEDLDLVYEYLKFTAMIARNPMREN